MTSSEARGLIENAIVAKTPSTWIDLGCGSGTFTYALADLLCEESKIVAIDRLSHPIASKRNGVDIEFKQADFERQELFFENVDGILIANALHYVKDQEGFLRSIKPWLKEEGQLILIEYDTDKSNQWVPFPLTFEKVRQLLLKIGFGNVKKIGEHDSRFRDDQIFACLASF